jgi:hypothetical protein
MPLGFAAGKDHTITLRSFLSSKQGSKLGKEFVASRVTLPDLPESIAFSGKQFILPNTGPGEIPISVNNVQRFDLELFRITDRTLHRHIALGHVGGQLPFDEYKDLRQHFAERLWLGRVKLDNVDDQRNKLISCGFRSRRSWISGVNGYGTKLAIVRGMPPRFPRYLDYFQSLPRERSRPSWMARTLRVALGLSRLPQGSTRQVYTRWRPSSRAAVLIDGSHRAKTIVTDSSSNGSSTPTSDWLSMKATVSSQSWPVPFGREARRFRPRSNWSHRTTASWLRARPTNSEW